MSKEVLLDVRHLTQQFHLTKKIKVKAVDDVSFQIHKGEIFGLVGESGSGKSTVARCLMNIYQPAQGEIWYKDVNICDKKEFKKHKKMLQTRRQMIFQDSASSLNQKMKVSDIITEPMRIQTVEIIVLGIVAFGVGTAGGVLLGKVMCVVTHGKINPLIGSAGVSAVPMAARVSQKVGQEYNPRNYLLMHAMGPNVAGVIGSAVAAGILINMFG